jgi:oxaloacetate decarboxylase alpha subunit
MKTNMALPIAAQLDQAGFDAAEIVSAAFFKKCVRELRDDPIERIRLVSQRMPNTPLRAIRSRYMAAFHITPTSVSRLWLERVKANGVREIRLSDPSNNPVYWKDTLVTASEVGLRTIVNLIFSVSPRHTDEYYAEKARSAAKLSPYRICLKDPGGLLTPERTRTLVPLILKNSDNIPVELHTHCTTGLGPLCCVEALRLGVLIFNTAIPPLANGSSNPSIFNVVKNARALGYEPLIDEPVLQPISQHFTFVARREGLPLGSPVEYDGYHPIHQVPGGMISNFRHQLSKVGMEGKLDEILEEVARVRSEFGYPIMVTPYSQFVGVQAATNVILGERYREATDEVIQYALGLWGEEESVLMDPDVKDKILSRPRAKELSQWEPPQSSLRELREKFGGLSVNDDDLLLRYFAGNEDVEALRAAGPASAYPSVTKPLLGLIAELTQKKHCHQIYIRKGDLSLRLERQHP